MKQLDFSIILSAILIITLTFANGDQSIAKTIKDEETHNNLNQPPQKNPLIDNETRDSEIGDNENNAEDNHEIKDHEIKDHEIKTEKITKPKKINVKNNGRENHWLTTLLKSAYQNNPEIKSAYEQVKITAEEINIAYGFLRPKITASYKKGNNEIKFDNAKPREFDTKTREIKLVQPLFKGGRTITSIVAEYKMLNKALEDYRQVEEEVFLSIIKSYADIKTAELVLEVAENNEERLKLHLEANKIRFRVGEVTGTDVAYSQSRFATAKARKIRAEAELKNAKIMFAKISFMSSDNLPNLEDNFDDEKIDENTIETQSMFNMPDDLPHMLQMLESHNSTIIATQHELKAINWKLYEQYGQLLPEVKLVAIKKSASGQLYFTGNVEESSLTIEVNIPIYGGGGEWGNIRNTERKIEQVKYNILKTKLSVEHQANVTWNNYVAAKSELSASKIAKQASAKALIGVKSEMELGARNALDLLDAETESFNAELQLIKTKQELFVRFYQLMNIMGKLNSENIGIDVDKRHKSPSISWFRRILGF